MKAGVMLTSLRQGRVASLRVTVACARSLDDVPHDVYLLDLTPAGEPTVEGGRFDEVSLLECLEPVLDAAGGAPSWVVDVVRSHRSDRDGMGEARLSIRLAMDENAPIAQPIRDITRVVQSAFAALARTSWGGRTRAFEGRCHQWSKGRGGARVPGRRPQGPVPHRRGAPRGRGPLVGGPRAAGRQRGTRCSSGSCPRCPRRPTCTVCRWVRSSTPSAPRSPPTEVRKHHPGARPHHGERGSSVSCDPSFRLAAGGVIEEGLEPRRAWRAWKTRWFR